MNNPNTFRKQNTPKIHIKMNRNACRILILLLASWMVFPVIIQANNLSPVPVIERPSNSTTFQSNVPVTFDGSNSYDPDNTNIINYYRWYVDWQLMASGPSKSTFTTTFTIPAGSTTKSVHVKLKVRDDENSTNTRINTLTLYSTTYYLTDHLGSIRTTIDHFGNVIGYDDYYPFGLPMAGRSSNLGNPNDLNKFTGHERDNEGGLMIDYMLARNYDPEIGRFMSVDPLVHKYPSWSPYAYVMNNPLIYIDPAGKLTYIDRNGKVTEVTEDGSTSIFQVVENDDGTTYTNVGNTLVWDSFNTDDVIDLNSNWAGEQIDNALNEIGDSFYTKYAPNGYGRQKYDLKSNLPKGKSGNFGSQLKDGIFVNPREAGNILAGAAARQGGLDVITAFTGFGALQIGQDLARNAGVSNTFMRQGPAVAIGAAVFMSSMTMNPTIGLVGV